MYLKVLKLTLLFYLYLLQNAVAQECRAKNSINFNRNHLNKRLNGFVIKNITIPAAADCARECFRLTKCLSFNMATSIRLCQLNSVNSSTKLIPNLVADHKFNYFDLSVFPETIAGPCGNKPCLMHQMCLPTKKDKHFCANVECPPYIAPKNGKVKPTTAVIADRNVTVSCRAGFSIVGDSLLTCQFDEHWRGVAPKCKRDCPPAVAPSNGQVSAPNSYEGETATYTCRIGYSLIGSGTATCANGAWSPVASLCKQDCPPAVAPSDGEVSAPNSYEGETATYTCLIGYCLFGSETATCAHGAWSPVAPLCKQVDCYDVKHRDDVYCDMVTDGGGWTVFQRRFNGSVDFYRTFKEYENGFGDLRGEFWLGLRCIQDMTSQGNTELRIDLEAADGSTAYQTYHNLSLSGVNYALHIGQSAGNAGDNNGLSFNNGAPFSTYDQGIAANCGVIVHGGWWYWNCAYVNLNGHYATPGTSSHYESGWGGVIYYDFKGLESLKYTKMMFRRN